MKEFDNLKDAIVYCTEYDSYITWARIEQGKTIAALENWEEIIIYN